MADGDSGIAVKEELGNREADYLAAADYDCPLPLDFHACLVEHTDDALRCARHGARLLLPERGDIERVEAVNVLVLGNCRNDLVLVDMVRQRKLDEYAVHGVIGIETGNDVKEFCLGDVSRLEDGGVAYAYYFGGLGLAADV